MKEITIGILMCLLVASMALAQTVEDAGGIQLVKDGRSAYRIILSPQASTTERAAARELADHLKDISGAEYPVLSGHIHPIRDGRPETVPTEILVGRSPRLDEVAPDIDWQSLGEQGYMIKTVGQRLIIAGGPRAGTLNAVYDFLEKYLGCRWFTPDLSVIPKQSSIALPAIDETYTPPFQFRRIPNFDSFRAPWAVRNHLNFWYGHKYLPLWKLLADPRAADGYFNPSVALASFWDAGLFDRTHLEPFLKDNPDCYAKIKGQRTPGNQYCWGNPKLKFFILGQVDRWKEVAPHFNVLPLGMGDFKLRTCECQMCGKLVTKHSVQAGGQSGEFNDFANLTMAFTNEVCDAVAEEYPELTLMTFAYNETIYPPSRVRPHKDLWIVFADIGGNGLHALDEGANLCRGTNNLMQTWLRLTNGKVLYYDYAMSPVYLSGSVFYPYPMLYRINERYQALQELGCRGTCPSTGHAADGPRHHLQSYVLAQVLWNPDYDVSAGIEEFCRAYFGAAAPYMIRYNSEILSADSYAVLSSGQRHLQKSRGPSAAYDDFMRFKTGTFARWDALFDQAEEAVADDPVLLGRVKEERLAVQLGIFYTTKPGNPLLDKAIRHFFPAAQAFIAANHLPETKFAPQKGGSYGIYNRIPWLRPDEPDAPKQKKLTLKEFKRYVLAFAEKETWSAPPEPPAGKAGKRHDLPVSENSLGMKFVEIPAGSFEMGSQWHQADERPVHSVTLSSFALGRTEMTQAQYEKVMGANPSHFKGKDLPVENISEKDAETFCRKLSNLPEEKKAGRAYALPTEAQWEYACRAGSTSAHSWGADGEEASRYAWCAANAKARTHPAGALQPNPWGLYDMHGNVWELVATAYKPRSYSEAGVVDPAPSSRGRVKVIRGGSYDETPYFLRSSLRGRGFLHYQPTRVVGFRVVLTNQ